MIHVKHLVLGGLLVCISIIIQSIPVFFSEVFIFITMLSALPIYILARMNPRAGVIGFIAADILIFCFNSHEGLFFLFTNGIVGLSLGILSFYTQSRILISLGSGLSLACSLSIMNFIMGISVFIIQIQSAFLIQISILLLFSICYCSIYSSLADFTFHYLNKRLCFITKKQK